MQTLSWYVRRLRAMSGREIMWRIGGVVRDTTDRVRYPLVRRKAGRVAKADRGGAFKPGFQVCNVASGAWQGAASGSREAAWLRRLLLRSAPLVQHRLTFFDQQEAHLGDPIDWNRDVKSGVAAPLKFAPEIDYRDVAVSGDCKFVWEPNRHHHLVVLARAYRASGDQRIAIAAAEQFESWLDQCPFGLGMNWRSPLELGVRLINWVWAIDLLLPSGAISPALLARLRHSAELHCWDTDRKYSQASSANNHLIGEAAGVYIASCYFADMPRAAEWRGRAREILCREILLQTHADGGTREQALGYHRFVLEFFAAVAEAAAATGDSLPAAYFERLRTMADFLAAFADGGEQLPMIGDADDGYVLDLGAAPRCLNSTLARINRLLGRSSTPEVEALCWSPAARPPGPQPIVTQCSQEGPLASVAFAETGYYLLQFGSRDAGDRISVCFDCGPLGYGPLAAHGHADALSFSLRVFGRDVLVDPGTFDYFTYPAWRDYFRSTRAHNTIEVDGEDQSVNLGRFQWGRQAVSGCVDWSPTAAGGAIVAEHDGYTRLADPVVHRRRLELDGPAGLISIRDDISASGSHRISQCFHVAEGARVELVSRSVVSIQLDGGTVTLHLDPRLAVELLEASMQPIAGWVSRGYHVRQPSVTLVGRCVSEGNLTLATRIDIRRCETVSDVRRANSECVAAG